MAGYLLDTNALIKWFGKFEGHEHIAHLIEKPENRLFTSIICVLEFLNGCGAEEAGLLKKIIGNGDIEVISFNAVSQAESAAELRKKFGLKTPDAIIASAALENNLTLVTFDADIKKKVKAVLDIY
ncbi:MAG: PIN domain-containing protein [bacterium]